MVGQWEPGSIWADDLRLKYWRTGGPGPPVVLAHGITDHGLCWTRVARALEAECDLIMYDARGHGGSGKPETGYTYANLAGDLIQLVSELGLERPAVIGHSMGARTAATAAATRPEAFGALILQDPPWRGIDDRAPAPHIEPAARLAARQAEVEERRAMGAAGLAADLRQKHPDWHEDEIVPWCEAQTLVSPLALGLYDDVPALWEDECPRLACPVLLVTGDPDRGAIVTPAVASESMSLCVNGEIAHLAGAGHCVHRDRFDAAVAAMGTFLRRAARP